MLAVQDGQPGAEEDMLLLCETPEDTAERGGQAPAGDIEGEDVDEEKQQWDTLDFCVGKGDG